MPHASSGSSIVFGNDPGGSRQTKATRILYQTLRIHTAQAYDEKGSNSRETNLLAPPSCSLPTFPDVASQLPALAIPSRHIQSYVLLLANPKQFAIPKKISMLL